MNHKISIGVSKTPTADAVISSRCITVRERILRWIFGDVRRVMIVLPSDSVSEIMIQETQEV